MNRLIVWVIALLLGTSLAGHTVHAKTTPSQTETTSQKQSQPVAGCDENLIKNLVESFGKKLQMVSLSASPELVAASIQKNYAAFISPTLLVKWQKEPGEAPGRITSSPWPDRIEVLTLERLSESLYKVGGQIVTITGAEKANGGFTAKQPIIFIVKKIDSRWLIDEIMTNAPATTQSIVYRNTQYGFTFTLPNSWKGYTIVAANWEGRADGEPGTAETGPLLLIRHPEWTSENPRQDIPIMVLTVEQWNSLQDEKFHIGAAPIGPGELGRNHKYVFALPARYNFAFPTGYEEVETILSNKPLQPSKIPE